MFWHCWKPSLSIELLDNYFFRWWHLLKTLQDNPIYFNSKADSNPSNSQRLPSLVRFSVLPFMAVLLFGGRALLGFFAFTLWSHHEWARPFKLVGATFESGVRVNIMVCAVIWSIQGLVCIGRDFSLTMNDMSFMAVHAVQVNGPIRPVDLREFVILLKKLELIVCFLLDLTAHNYRSLVKWRNMIKMIVRCVTSSILVLGLVFMMIVSVSTKQFALHFWLTCLAMIFMFWWTVYECMSKYALSCPKWNKVKLFCNISNQHSIPFLDTSFFWLTICSSSKATHCNPNPFCISWLNKYH